MRKIFSIVFAFGIAGFATAESVLVTAAGITQGTADGLYVNEAGDDMTGPLTVTEAGLPLTATNTTDAAENVVFTLYTNRGTGVDDDKAVIDIFFDDDASSKTLPGSFFFQAEDLAAKGGSTGGFGWRSGSISPVTNFFCSGAEDNLQANFFSLLLDSDTGMRGGVDLLQWAIANITHLQLVGGGTDELQLLAGYNFTAVGSGSFGDKFAVGLPIGSIDASVRFQVGGTTLGSLPAPRVTAAQRLAIASGTPTDGTQADDSDLNALFRYNSVKAKWERFVVDRSPIVVMFSGGIDLPYFTTANAVYTTAGIFLFGGTDALGTPANIKVVGFKDAGPTSWDIQVLDITNATTIATLTGSSGTAPEIVDLGTLSNLPAAQAMFEVQIKRAGGLPADFVFAHSVTIEF